MTLLTRKLSYAIQTKDWRLVEEAYHMAANGQAKLKRKAIEHPWKNKFCQDFTGYLPGNGQADFTMRDMIEQRESD